MNSEEFVQSLIQEVIGRFKSSRYPSLPLELTGQDDFELLIRIPPRVPAFIDMKYSSYRDKFAASPAIERINLPEQLRNQGFFSGLVSALGSLQGIEAVCVSNVTNPGFAQSLAGSDIWQEIESDFHFPSEPAALSAAIMLNPIPSFYRRFPKD